MITWFRSELTLTGYSEIQGPETKFLYAFILTYYALVAMKSKCPQKIASK